MLDKFLVILKGKVGSPSFERVGTHNIFIMIAFYMLPFTCHIGLIITSFNTLNSPPFSFKTVENEILRKSDS